MYSRMERDERIRDYIKREILKQYLRNFPYKGLSNRCFDLGDSYCLAFREGFKQALTPDFFTAKRRGFIDGYIEGIALLEYLRIRANNSGVIGNIVECDHPWRRIKYDVDEIGKDEDLDKELMRIEKDAFNANPPIQKRVKPNKDYEEGVGGKSGDNWDD